MRGWKANPRLGIVGLLILALSTPASDGRYLSLYDWMYPAENVIAGRALDEAGKNTAVLVERVFRGTIAKGATVEVRVKRANRERDESDHRLTLKADTLYALLLTPRTDPDASLSYEFVRGVEGAREVPAEGASAFMDAMERFAQVQGMRDDSQQWHAFDTMLEETNPILIQTSLEQYLKFRRGTPEIALRVRPLLQHPRPDIRTSAVELCGALLEQYPATDFPDLQGLEMDIVALARRDPSTEVRVAAVVALKGLADVKVVEIWKEISRDDPDQQVRYTAERLLYEHGQEQGRSPG